MGIKFQTKEKRNRAIYAFRKKGWTLQRISVKFDISRERAMQIYNRQVEIRKKSYPHCST